METNEFISILALMVSCVAVSLSFYEGWQSRRHHRLSVKPSLDIDTHIHNSELKLEISNHGLGPAVITSFSVEIDRIPVRANKHEFWSVFLEKLNFNNYDIQYYTPGDSAIMSAGGNKAFLQAQLAASSEEILTAITRISVAVNYQSIYGETYQSKLEGSEFHQNV